jgi:hypothetical protein
MPASVSIAPIQRPNAALCRVAQTCHASTRPLWAVLLAPRSAAFGDRRRASGEDELGADLMQGVGRDTLLAVVANSRDVEPWEHAEIVVTYGHAWPLALPRIVPSREPSNTPVGSPPSAGSGPRQLLVASLQHPNGLDARGTDWFLLVPLGCALIGLVWCPPTQ